MGAVDVVVVVVVVVVTAVVVWWQQKKTRGSYSPAASVDSTHC